MDKFDIAARVRELNSASEAYYNSDNPIMSDYEFDCKYDEYTICLSDMRSFYKNYQG